MKELFISKNTNYLKKIGIMINENIIKSAKNNNLPELDDLIEFSNNSGISINDFLFVDIEQRGVNKLI